MPAWRFWNLKVLRKGLEDALGEVDHLGLFDQAIQGLNEA